jgi:hypothetical protein
VAQQRKDAQPQHVRRRLVSGQQQQPGDPDQFVVAELVAVLAHEHAENVLARIVARALDEAAHVIAALALQFKAFWQRCGQVELPGGPLLEIIAVLVRNPEQLADHQ